ncbi:mitofusin-2-like [Amphiura filiformis]|uniref:mitofusin-2-like n=1 Tax=Amphiura filiformis TaxID=82378 RepID=UPI003B220B24
MKRFGPTCVYAITLRFRRLNQGQPERNKDGRSTSAWLNSNNNNNNNNKDTVHRFIQHATCAPGVQFANARNTIRESFRNLLQVIQPCFEVCENTISFPVETIRDQDDKLKALQTQLNECRQKTVAIMPILERDKMKAVVFGCTSSGKSTLINAMLDVGHVLPTGMGRSSSCLVQIEGCDEQDSFLTLPDGTRKSVEDLEKLGSELEDGHLGAEETAIVYWPKSKCKLLSNDIQIIDRPGISNNPEVDKAINSKCSDADVHIFVVDSVASITTESREYFLSVAEKLSKPNIFFVWNKWDESAKEKSEIKRKKVYQQHVKEAKTLMREALNAEVDEKKLFFVSAEEIIMAKTDQTSLRVGHQKRKADFDRFLKELQESISACAIKTKFGPHCYEGIALCDRLDALAQGILESLDHVKEELAKRNGQLTTENDKLELKWTQFETVCEEVIEKAKTSLERKVSREKKELSRLDEISKQEGIHFEEDNIDGYKEAILVRFQVLDRDELHSNIEEARIAYLADIERNLHTRWREDIPDINFPTTPNMPGLQKPQISLNDLGKDSPSYADKMEWFRKSMSSSMARMTTGVGSVAVGTVLGAAAHASIFAAGIPVAIGGGAIACAMYLDSIREFRKIQITETIKQSYRKWLDEAQAICHTQGNELINDIKEAFNEKIDGEYKANRNLINFNKDCIQQLEIESENLKTYKKSQLPNVKKSFKKFEQDYLQDKPEDNDSETKPKHDDFQFF